MNTSIHVLPDSAIHYLQTPWTRIARRTASLVTAMAAITIAGPAAALDLTTEDNAPFNYVDANRHVAGISTDILVEMGRRAGVPIKIQVTPWARAYQTALNSADNCVYSTVRLPEREVLFKWVGPISTNKWALFAKSDFNKPLATIEDARNYRIGGVIMDAKAMYLKSLGFANFDLVGDDKLNMGKLLAGRIDLWISGLYKGREMAAQVGIKNIKPVFIVREVEYYLACHPKTSDATLTALNNALMAMQKEGVVKKVTEHYAGRMQP